MSYFCRIILLLIVPAVVACEETNAPPGATVCFTTEVEAVLDAGCGKSGCHDDVLATPSLIVAGDPTNSNLMTLLTTTDTTLRMPPSPWPRLDTTMIDAIRQWIVEGAHTEPCTSAPRDTSDVRYAKHIKPLVDLYCIGCHAMQRSGSGPVLRTHEQVRNEVLYGRFMVSIERRAGYVPMPPGRTIVNERDLDLIRIWVARGMP